MTGVPINTDGISELNSIILVIQDEANSYNFDCVFCFNGGYLGREW